MAPLDVGAVCLVDDYYRLIRDTFGGDFRLTRLSEIDNWRLLGRTENHAAPGNPNDNVLGGLGRASVLTSETTNAIPRRLPGSAPGS